MGLSRPSAAYARVAGAGTIECMLTAIISLSPDTCTLGAVRGFLRDAERFAVPTDTRLIDGGHAFPATFPDRTIGSFGGDLASVIALAETLTELPDEAEVVYATDVALDLPVFAVEPIVCGEHLRAAPENVIVTVNPDCSGHDA